MQVKTELTEAQWQIADAIARTLVLANTDVNELRKAISYLRTYANQGQGGAKFFAYLKTLVCNGNRIGHSKRTTEYYERIEATCSQYLAGYKDDATTMLNLLG